MPRLSGWGKIRAEIKIESNNLLEINHAASLLSGWVATLSQPGFSPGNWHKQTSNVTKALINRFTVEKQMQLLRKKSSHSSVSNPSPGYSKIMI